MKKKWIISIIIIAILATGIIAFQFSKKSQQPQFIEGEEVLEVKITMDNGVPLANIEIDLWKAGSTGPPDAGYNFTNEEGTAIFNIPEGEYEIGFNLNNFPDNLIYPEKTSVTVEKDIPASKTILIQAEQE